MKAEKKSEAVKYDARSFIIRGKRELLIGGEFHYFRTPRELWEDRILKIKQSGSNLITTYIPWNWHEQFEGQEQWDGDHDLAYFLELCTQHGMFIIVKPGPYCCAELDFGGHPDWILGKKIPLRVLNAKYLAIVEKWYKRVAEVVKPYLVTNGGNVFSIQVENEYDHLIHLGKESISRKDALTYFDKLVKMMDKYGIDVPKFANEAEFLRGRKGIIDTRTYYPTIPVLPGWEWKIEHYDEKIMHAKEGQPDCPTMILELQMGWFGMHGHDWKYPGLNLTEAVSKSVLMAGASVLNWYMVAGGTTFPFWGSRGDISNIHPRGIGLTTTFDFGGSPVHEWGELMPGRFDWIKAFNRFAVDYQSLILESDNVNELQVISGGEGVKIISQDKFETDVCLKHPEEKFTLLVKKRENEYLVGLRNLSPEVRSVAVGFTKTGEVVLPNVTLQPYETFILPVNVKVPGADLTIVRSTSELLFARKTEGGVHFGLYGKGGEAGETVLNVPAVEMQVVTGQVKVSGGQQAVLTYEHQGIKIVKVKGHYLWILDQSLAGKVEPLAHGTLIADTYSVRGLESQNGQLLLKTEMKNGSDNLFYYFGSRRLTSASADGRNLDLNNSQVTSFAHQAGRETPVKLDWTGDWKVSADLAEAQPGYDDRRWTLLKKPISLEEAGLLEHGYIWYRSEFKVPAGSRETVMVFPANDTDRFYVYINGKRVWNGITTEAVINIQDAVKTGKNVVAVLYQNFFHTKSHPNEGAIQKYSGLMKPLTVKGKAKGKSFSTKISSFRVRQQLNGLLNGCTKMGYDDSRWLAVEPGRKYIMGPKIETLLWMRRKFKFQARSGWSFGAKVTIPNGWERCLLYLNGRALGWFEGVGPQHDFFIPESWLQPENVLAIVLEAPGEGNLVQPELGTFYEAKAVEVKMQFA